MILNKNELVKSKFTSKKDVKKGTQTLRSLSLRRVKKIRKKNKSFRSHLKGLMTLLNSYNYLNFDLFPLSEVNINKNVSTNTIYIDFLNGNLDKINKLMFFILRCRSKSSFPRKFTVNLEENSKLNYLLVKDDIPSRLIKKQTKTQKKKRIKRVQKAKHISNELILSSAFKKFNIYLRYCFHYQDFIKQLSYDDFHKNKPFLANACFTICKKLLHKIPEYFSLLNFTDFFINNYETELRNILRLTSLYANFNNSIYLNLLNVYFLKNLEFFPFFIGRNPTTLLLQHLDSSSISFKNIHFPINFKNNAFIIGDSYYNTNELKSHILNPYYQTSFISPKTTVEQKLYLELKQLDLKMTNIFNEYSNGTKSSENIFQTAEVILKLLSTFLIAPAVIEFSRSSFAGKIPLKKLPHLIHITKVVLHFVDNVLTSFYLKISSKKESFLATIRENLILQINKLGECLKFIQSNSNVRQSPSNYAAVFAANYIEYDYNYMTSRNSSSFNDQKFCNSGSSNSNSFDASCLNDVNNLSFTTQCKDDTQLNVINTDDQKRPYKFNAEFSKSHKESNKSDATFKNDYSSLFSPYFNTEFSMLSKKDTNKSFFERFMIFLNILSQKIQDSGIDKNEGAFIACVARGFSSDFCVFTVICGFSEWNSSIIDCLNSFSMLLPEVHIVFQKNHIVSCGSNFKPENCFLSKVPKSLISSTDSSFVKSFPKNSSKLELIDTSHGSNEPSLAAMSTASAMVSTSLTPTTEVRNLNISYDGLEQQDNLKDFEFGQLCLPFRIPKNLNSPPISVSLAAEDASTISGTFGGYVYPKFKDDQIHEYEDYNKSVFGMTCAHVCLTEYNGENPSINVPSNVLINMYRNSIKHDMLKYSKSSKEYKIYANVLKQIELKFPKKKDKCSTALPFGKVIWAERTIVNGFLSDVAIIQCREGIKGNNTLGEDINFSEYDSSLIFDNLNISHVIKANSSSLESRLNNEDKRSEFLDKVLEKQSKNFDSHITDFGLSGMPVFKYGSTSKYTKGTVNGPKLIYWAGGKKQTSEFVVASENTPFASGGDSGAWILTKTKLKSGLGVVGMLYAYDGEHKEFGLFSPMTQILNRLNEITGIEWGVLGDND